MKRSRKRLRKRTQMDALMSAYDRAWQKIEAQLNQYWFGPPSAHGRRKERFCRRNRIPYWAPLCPGMAAWIVGSGAQSLFQVQNTD